MRRLSFLLALAVAACAVSEPSAPVDRGQSPLAATFEQASAESGVPADLLLAVAYVESRFSQRAGEPSVLRGFGMMHLREGATLDQASQLTGETTTSLKREATANIRAAAQVLAELGRSTTGVLPAQLVDWKPALERYSGVGELSGEYVRQVFQVLQHGAEGTDDLGASLRVPAHPEAALTDLGDGLGLLGFEARPDYSGAKWVGPSPNSSSRSGTKIDMVVIHTCQGGFSGCVSWLLNPAADASAHYVVSSGGTVNQLVEEYLKGWHATCVNSRSVGIEHEGYISDPSKWYTEAMYCASAKLVRSICDRNGIPCDRSHVIGHKEANDKYCGPGHTDPGSGWNWTKFMSYVQSGCGGTGTGRLVGYVYKNPTNDAASRLAGATVKLSNGTTATTNSSGLYSFTVAPGSYTATASASGYQSTAVTRTVAAGADTWGSIGLDATAALSTGKYYGSVYEVNPADPADLSKKLPGATVTLDTGASTTSRPSDAIFKFDDVKAGTHTATATLAGYKANSSTKTVTACAETSCAVWGSIGLSKEGGTPVAKPTVAITSPANGAQLDEAQFDLTGQVDNSTDVKTVKVAWGTQSVDAPLGAGASFNVPVKVPSGDTKITVSATNSAGTGTAEITVHFKSGICGYVFEPTVEEGSQTTRIGGATIELLPAEDQCAAAVATATSKSPDGTFCIDAAPGDYYLRARAGEHLTTTELITVSSDRRDTVEVAVAKGTDAAPRITLKTPAVGDDGKVHLATSAFDLEGEVFGMFAIEVTVGGKPADLAENVFTAKDVAAPAGESTVALEATGKCGEKASLSVSLVRSETAGADAGVAGDSGAPKPPVQESGACGCATGGEGLGLFALLTLVGAFGRRRR